MGTIKKFAIIWKDDFTEEQHKKLVEVLGEEGWDFDDDYKNGYLDFETDCSWSFRLDKFLRDKDVKGKFTIEETFMERDPDETYQYDGGN